MKMQRSAAISHDGNYRWLLTRRWNKDKPSLRWIMLNPSIADGEYDTPTLERVIRISKILGYGGCIVVNLYAWRSPKALQLRGMSQTKAIGDRNNYVLRRVGEAARKTESPVMVAWGSQAMDTRVRFVINTYFWGLELKCLGHNKSGHPIHPLSGTVKMDSIKEEIQPWKTADLDRSSAPSATQ